MLLKYRNQLFNTLKNSFPDLSYIDYEYDDQKREFDYLKISVKDSGLFFLVKNPKDNYHIFHCEYTDYHSPKLTTDTYSGVSRIDTVCEILGYWIQRNFNKWYTETIQDATQEDLWSTYFKGKKYLDLNQIDFQDQDYFSQDEKKHIITSLEAVKLKIKGTSSLQLSEDGLNLIEQRIEYLKSATEKLTKFEWKSVLISTIISIIIALSLDTAKGEALIEIFKQAFTFVPRLLGLD